MAANQTVSVYGTIPPRYTKQRTTSKRQEVVGLGFPLGAMKTGGYFSKKSGVELIKSAVKQLLLTERGERIMLPNYGCSLRKYLFQPLTESVFESIKREIQYSFNNYIVGAHIVKVSAFPLGEVGPSGGNSVKVVLSLRLNSADLEVFEVEVDIS